MKNKSGIGNEINQKIIDDIKKHSTDIDKIYESILTIRNIMSSQEDEITMKNNKFFTKFETDFNDFKDYSDKKFADLSKIDKKIRCYIDESHAAIIELKFNDSGNDMKDFFKTIIYNLKQVTDKSERTSIRLDNLSTELLMKLKKDLKCKYFLKLIKYLFM